MLESPDNEILQEDIEQAVAQNLPFDELKDSRVFVTGATGLIGSQVIKFLLCLNRLKNMNITVIAFARSKEKAKKVFPYLEEEDHLTLALGDISNPVDYAGEVDYILHGASPTSSKYFVSNPVETITTAMDGTRYVLDFAKEKQVKGVVYLSSLEVYGTPAEDAGMITEKDYGYIDPLSVRSSYSEGKRIIECLCASYAKEYNVPVKVARLSQTFGAGVEYDDGRVFAEFARCAIEGRNIVLHTEGKTVRSYCYTMDAVTALLTILIKGKTGEAYNVTNMDTAISIYDMAKLVCELQPESGISVEKDIPEDLASFGYNPEMVIRLDATRLQELGWQATVDMQGMYKRLIASMKLEK
ncbi:MAG: NAD-dependent epimerase/dehydratase family protein [Lachnospiraceae bacterium]|nr:NAD-dependent epimerase/dehydratase family protein [Lachnospiraceae bacterium]